MLNEQINGEIENEPDNLNRIRTENNNMVDDNSNFYIIKTKQLKYEYMVLNIKRNICYFIISFICTVFLGYISKVILWSNNKYYENKLIGRNSSIFNNFESFACHIDLGLIFFCFIYLMYYFFSYIENNFFNRLNATYDDNDFHLIRA